MVRAADSERVLRRRRGERLRHPAHRLGEQRPIGGERPAAEAVAVEADLGELGRAASTEALDAATLDDREDARHLAPTLGDLEVELLAASLGPADGSLDGAFLLIQGRLRIGAVVEANDDVGSELELQLDHPLGGQVPLFAGRRLAKDHLVVADHAALRILADQAPDLEAPGVGQDRTIPVHEPMHASGRLHHPRARAPQQVEGIDHEAVDADRAQVLTADAAHAGARRVRHEGRNGQDAPLRGQRVSHHRGPPSRG